MAQYFFKMSQAEKNNILDQHKSLYDGYVTEYAKESNMQPLYVQDFANDKQGLTVSNKGVVKSYTNVGINESINRRDRIGDGPMDLKGGTVDLSHEMMHDEYPSPNEDEFEYISLGERDEDMDDDTDLSPSYDSSGEFLGMEKPLGDMEFYSDEETDELEEMYEYDIDEMDDFQTEPMNEVDFEGEIDDEVLPEFMDKLHESLDMFRRFKKYN